LWARERARKSEGWALLGRGQGRGEYRPEEEAGQGRARWNAGQGWRQGRSRTSEAGQRWRQGRYHGRGGGKVREEA
jgi:hypothetical protein